jgi:hypothetical protein
MSGLQDQDFPLRAESRSMRVTEHAAPRIEDLHGAASNGETELSFNPRVPRETRLVK